MLLIAVALLFIALFIVVPAPTRFLLPLGVGAPELSPPFALASLVLLVVTIARWRGGSASLHVAACLAAVAFALFVLPSLQFRSTARAARAELEAAFGEGAGEYHPDDAARMRTRTLRVAQLLTGLGADDARESHAVPFASPGGQQLTMEIYRPRDLARYPGARPVIVQVYGGAWQRGAPTDDAAFARYFAERGYVVFAVDYRHAPAHRFPAQVDDIRSALSWIDAHAAEFQADTSRMVLLGRSAGAHLAMLAAYMPGAHALRGVVSFYGPVDLVEGYRKPPTPDPLHVRDVETAFMGGTPDDQEARYREASPITYVRPGLPRTLLMYGARDHIVEAHFGRRLRDALRRAGNSVVYVELPWAEHAFDAVPNGLSGQLSLYVVERFVGRVVGNGE